MSEIHTERGANGVAYCWTEVPVGGGMTLYLDGNGKVTAGNGTYENPTPNSFSLPHQSTCPGATPSCLSSCYVHGLEKHAPAVYARYRQNERTLHCVLMATMTHRRSAEILGAWISEHARDGFRWHVSGDIMHGRHAQWIAAVCHRSREVQHWVYTKSFAVAPELAADNLTVNLSADRDNYAEARAWRWAGTRICYMSQAPDDVPTDLREGDVLFPDYPARGRELADPTAHPWWQARTPAERRMVCPPDFFGQSEAHRCGPCRKCIDRPGAP